MGITQIPTTARNETTRTTLPGHCQSFPLLPSNEVQTIESLACIEACQAELTLDEHFYHESWPVIQNRWSTSSHSRPVGCDLEFVRERNAPPPHRWTSVHQNDHDPSRPGHEPPPSI